MTEQPVRIDTTCPYCGVGCGVSAKVKDDRIIAVSGGKSHPANLGSLCVKGSALHETMGNHDRLLYPSINGQRVDWSTAIDTLAQKISAVREAHGPDAIAFYLSGQLLTEDYYVANKLAKGFIGTSNVDTNSRLCMSSAVASYKRAFGGDAVPCSYEDLESCDLLVMVGSNAAWTHPVLYRRMVSAKAKNPTMRVVVIDPRRTATCDLADLHLPILPGSDSFLYMGLLSWLHQNGHTNSSYIEAFTEGFGEALNVANQYSLAEIATQVGLDQETLTTFYQWFGNTEKTVTFYSQGINQSSSGTDKGNAIINCHLATGRVGKVGAGPFSITGQPNAMGGREVGGLANQLAAHMDYKPEDLQTVAEFWGTDHLSQRAGLKAVDMFDALAEGKIKLIWIMGTNPVVSLPNADKVKAALEACETVIVSDCIAHTDTTATANILLPATGWGEKCGTVTNSERRISRQWAMVTPPGEAQHDWWIMTQVAHRLGYGDAFPYEHPRDLFIEHAALSGFRNEGNRAFDISALSTLTRQQYDELKPVQWPVNAANPEGTARLFADGRFVTPSGKARFIAVQPRGPAQHLSREYPFALNSGRVRDQWHTMTRTARSDRLLNHIDAPFVLVHPDTAAGCELADGDLAEVSTRHGSVQVQVKTDEGMGTNQLFVPIHWNDQFASKARVGALIAPLTDPHSGQPEFKFSPASLRKVETPLWAAIISNQPLNCDEFIYWDMAPVGDGNGYCYRVATQKNFDWANYIRGCHGNFTGCAHYADEQYGDERFLCYQGQRVQLAVFSHRDQQALPSPDWLKKLICEDFKTSPWQLLAGRDMAQGDKGRLICSCFEVGEKQIISAIVDGACSVKQLGEKLKCGTNCGSCIPELNHLVNQTLKVDAA
ncbi:MAG: nitrate reductase [Porticoccaceae bacterium]